MFAAYHNHPHAVNELLNHHADLTITNLNDDTALSIAIKRSKDGMFFIHNFQV
jgi:ankyrin repeat protein